MLSAGSEAVRFAKPEISPSIPKMCREPHAYPLAQSGSSVVLNFEPLSNPNQLAGCTEHKIVDAVPAQPIPTTVPWLNKPNP